MLLKTFVLVTVTRTASIPVDCKKHNDYQYWLETMASFGAGERMLHKCGATHPLVIECLNGNNGLPGYDPESPCYRFADICMAAENPIMAQHSIDAVLWSGCGELADQFNPEMALDVRCIPDGASNSSLRKMCKRRVDKRVTTTCTFDGKCKPYYAPPLVISRMLLSSMFMSSLWPQHDWDKTECNSWGGYNPESFQCVDGCGWPEKSTLMLWEGLSARLAVRANHAWFRPATIYVLLKRFDPTNIFSRAELPTIVRGVVNSSILDWLEWEGAAVLEKGVAVHKVNEKSFTRIGIGVGAMSVRIHTDSSPCRAANPADIDTAVDLACIKAVHAQTSREDWVSACSAQNGCKIQSLDELKNIKFATCGQVLQFIDKVQSDALEDIQKQYGRRFRKISCLECHSGCTDNFWQSKCSVQKPCLRTRIMGHWAAVTAHFKKTIGVCELGETILIFSSDGSRLYLADVNGELGFHRGTGMSIKWVVRDSGNGQGRVTITNVQSGLALTLPSAEAIEDSKDDVPVLLQDLLDPDDVPPNQEFVLKDLENGFLFIESSMDYRLQDSKKGSVFMNDKKEDGQLWQLRKLSGKACSIKIDDSDHFLESEESLEPAINLTSSPLGLLLSLVMA